MIEQMRHGELIRAGIVNGQYPATLYKYFRLNDNLLNSIRERYLWFELFENYNDPYEGKCNLRRDYTESEIRDWLFGMGMIPALRGEEMLKQFTTALESAISNTARDSRVCCFSKKNDDLLMWAHYADSYRGVCLEFDTAILADDLAILMPVRYEEKYPMVDYLRGSDQVSMQMVLTKAKEWEYESEYRFVSPYPIDNKQPFNIQALKAVIVGCKCDQDSDMFKHLIDILPKHVQIKYSMIDKESYKLLIK